MLAAPARPLTAPADAPIEAGALADTHLFGMTAAGLLDGTSLRRIAWIGAALLLVGALLPIDVGGGLRLALGVDEVSGLAQALPIAMVLLGVALALVKQLPAIAVAALLAIAGVSELAFGLTPFGADAMTPFELPIATWLGLAVGAVGITVRVLRPTDPAAPWILVAAAAIYLGGGLLPHDDVDPLLPVELQVVGGLHSDGAVLSRAVDGLGDGMLFLPALSLLVPGAMLAIAALLAFRQPEGVWDRSGLPLRLLGMAIVLAIPLAYAFDGFNLLGFRFQDGEHPHVVVMRLRLAMLSAGAALWLAAGGAAALLIARRAATRG
jgi:hypothetical protein